jgi:hypothetical protein
LLPAPRSAPRGRNVGPGPSEARGARSPVSPAGHQHQDCEIASSLRPSLGSSR